MEEKETQLQKMRKDVKKLKDEKNALNTELEETRHDLCEWCCSVLFCPSNLCGVGFMLFAT